MPRKLRQLLKDYRKAGFEIQLDAGKGSHRKISHSLIGIKIILSGKDGADAHPYQERDLKEALQKLADAKKKQNPPQT